MLALDAEGLSYPFDLDLYAGGDVRVGYSLLAPAPIVNSIVRADPDPTSASEVDFTVTFTESVTGATTSDSVLATSGLSDASITGVSGSGVTYTVSVDTGSGDGTLRLDLVDDDSIVNSGGMALGGTGAGNGDFAAGEAYTVDKTVPVVSSVVRADASPTNAASVDFTVTFSEAVTGLDAGDFQTVVGGLVGESISSVSGSGDTYMVTVQTGSGIGTLRLDLSDDDTIVDAAGNLLGGAGAGNGDFSAGESYSVDRVGEIRGTKWEDTNGNGVRDSGEPGLGGRYSWTSTETVSGTAASRAELRRPMIRAPPE